MMSDDTRDKPASEVRLEDIVTDPNPQPFNEAIEGSEDLSKKAAKSISDIEKNQAAQRQRVKDEIRRKRKEMMRHRDRDRK